MAARAAFDHSISDRRLYLSVMTPAGNENSSQGSRCTTATSAISNGFRVMADASQG
jgi:hypothetical protein